MPIRNVIICAYKTSHVEVSDLASIAADGRRETYLELGTVDDRDLAIELATAVLAVQVQHHLAGVVDPMPRLGSTGFIDYGLGDSITDAGGSRVAAITVTQDDEGRASVIPELKDRVTIQQEAVDRLIRRLVEGGLGGKTEQASRTYPSPPPVLPGRVKTLEAVSYDGPLVAGIVSMPQSTLVPIQVVQIIVNLSVAGSSNTGIRVLDQDGNVRASTTVPAGRRLWAEEVQPPAYFSPSSQLIVDVPTAGTGAEGLAVQLQVTIP